MKKLLIGILALVIGFIIFTPLIVVGVVYTVIHSVVMAYKERLWWMFFALLIIKIDSTLHSIGNILLCKGLALEYDIIANIWGGELLEDFITTEEVTMFGEKDISISAAIGELEYSKKFMFERGRKLSKILNFVFSEKQHALGSWLRHLALLELEAKNLAGNY